MINLHLDPNGQPEQLTMVLSTRNMTWLGELNHVTDVHYVANMNEADELSFTIHKNEDDVASGLWDSIVDFKLVWVKELHEYFEITVSLDDTHLDVTKSITATSLCECELSQVNISGMELNNETDMERDDYHMAFLFTSMGYDKTAKKYYEIADEAESFRWSILGRVMSFVPNYTIGHVDTTLKTNNNRVPSFSVDGTSVYDFLTGDLADEYGCMFVFDSEDRTINIYDMMTICNNTECSYYIENDQYPYRGEFQDSCPICGSTDISYYGEDTTIFVDKENLSDTITYETDTDSVKNTFKLECGDDLMTATVINCNPNGSKYIYYFSDEVREDMDDELVEAIDGYDAVYSYYEDEYVAQIEPELISDFNEVYQRYIDLGYSDSVSTTASNYLPFGPLDDELVGYSALTNALYNIYDAQLFLQSSLMPTVTVTPFSETTSSYWAGVIETGVLNPCGMSSMYKAMAQSTLERAIVSYAKVYVPNAYFSIDVGAGVLGDYTYDSSGTPIAVTWTGTLVITNRSDEDDVVETNAFSVTLTTNLSDYVANKVALLISDYEDEDDAYMSVQEVLNTKVGSYSGATDEYSTTTRYYNGDYAVYNGQTYMCQTTNVNGVIGAFDPSVWQLMTSTYDASSSYAIGDCCTYNGNTYLCVDEISTPEEFNEEHWEEIEYGGFNLSEFYDKLKYYSLARLESFYDACDAIIDTMLTLSANNILEGGTNEYEAMIAEYYVKESTLNIAITQREDEIEIVETLGASADGNSFTDIEYVPAYITGDISSIDDYIVTLEVTNSTNPDISGTWTIYSVGGYVNESSGAIIPYEVGNSMTVTTNGTIQTEIEKIHRLVNFQAAIGDMYNDFLNYRREDTYSNSNYISDGLSNAQLIANAKEFLEAAHSDIVKSGEYQHTISANMYDLLLMPEFKPIVNHFELGNFIRLKCDGQLYRLRLIKYEVDYSDLSTLNVEFSDMTKSGNGYNDLQSILSQASSMATSYSSVQTQATNGETAKNTLENMRLRGLDAALYNISANTNEAITIDNLGITGREYDPILEKYSDEQFRLTHNIMAFTDDNWQSVSLALGKFGYYMPTITYDGTGDITSISYDNPEWNVGYGLNADFVIAGYVQGSMMIGNTVIAGDIYSKDGSTTHIDLNDGTFSFANGALKFYRNNQGNYVLYCQGTIESQDGHIGGWTIDSTSIYSGVKKTSTTNVNGVYLGSGTSSDLGSPNCGGIAVGTVSKDNFGYTHSAFTVLPNGTMYAKNAYVDGKLYSTEGHIGGWTITSNSLYSGTKSSLHADIAGVFLGSNTSSGGIALGKYDSDWGHSRFEVTPQGTLYAKEAVIEGTIYAEDGEFNGTVYATDGEFTGDITASTIIGSEFRSAEVDEHDNPLFYIDEEGNIFGATITGCEVQASTFTYVDPENGDLLEGDTDTHQWYGRYGAQLKIRCVGGIIVDWEDDNDTSDEISPTIEITGKHGTVHHLKFDRGILKKYWKTTED